MLHSIKQGIVMIEDPSLVQMAFLCGAAAVAEFAILLFAAKRGKRGQAVMAVGCALVMSVMVYSFSGNAIKPIGHATLTPYLLLVVGGLLLSDVWRKTAKKRVAIVLAHTFVATAMFTAALNIFARMTEWLVLSLTCYFVFLIAWVFAVTTLIALVVGWRFKAKS